jgi:hypothetical protein
MTAGKQTHIRYLIAGMLLSVTMVACNYTNVQALAMFLMSLAFFGKRFGALGWTVIADTSPKELIGLNEASSICSATRPASRRRS